MSFKNRKIALAIAAVAAISVYGLGLPPVALLQFGLLALCPLMMLFMHGGGHSGHGGNHKVDHDGKASTEPRETQHH